MIITNDTISLRKLPLAMVVFKGIIHPRQLPQFRGAIINMAQYDALFHNHQAYGFHYRYPRIQYRLIDNHPAVLGIEEGASRVSTMFGDKENICVRIGKNLLKLNIHSFAEWEDEAGLSEIRRNYIIEDWLPLNEANYREFQRTDGLINRLNMLQRILTGNILSFAASMNIFFDSKVECNIQDIEYNSLTRLKDVDMMSFSAAFSANVSLPQWIGLGKSASLNHGIILNSIYSGSSRDV